MDTREKLDAQTAEILAKINARPWPEWMKEEARAGAWKLHHNFLTKLAEQERKFSRP